MHLAQLLVFRTPEKRDPSLYYYVPAAEQVTPDCPHGERCTAGHPHTFDEVHFHPLQYKLERCRLVPNCTVKSCPDIHPGQEHIAQEFQAFRAEHIEKGTFLSRSQWQAWARTIYAQRAKKKGTAEPIPAAQQVEEWPALPPSAAPAPLASSSTAKSAAHHWGGLTFCPARRAATTPATAKPQPSAATAPPPPPNSHEWPLPVGKLAEKKNEKKAKASAAKPKAQPQAPPPDLPLAGPAPLSPEEFMALAARDPTFLSRFLPPEAPLPATSTPTPASSSPTPPTPTPTPAAASSPASSPLRADPPALRPSPQPPATKPPAPTARPAPPAATPAHPTHDAVASTVPSPITATTSTGGDATPAQTPVASWPPARPPTPARAPQPPRTAWQPLAALPDPVERVRPLEPFGRLLDMLSWQLSPGLQRRWLPVTPLATTPWSVAFAAVSLEEDTAAVLKCVRRAALPGMDFEALLGAVRRTPEVGAGLVAAVYDVELTADYLVTVEERCGCSLRDVLLGAKFPDPARAAEAVLEAYGAPLVLSVARQLCHALAAIHETGEAHGAVAPSNVLLHRQGRAVVATLAPCGLPAHHGGEPVPFRDAYFAPDQASQLPGPGHRPPSFEDPLYKTKLCYRWEQRGVCSFGDGCGFAHGEADRRPPRWEAPPPRNPVLLGQAAGRLKASQPADVFALGCVLWALATEGRHPFAGEDDAWPAYVQKLAACPSLPPAVQTVLGDEDGGKELLFRDLIESMLAKRLDMEGVLVHPFFWEPADYVNFFASLRLSPGVVEGVHRYAVVSDTVPRWQLEGLGDFLKSVANTAKTGDVNLVLTLVHRRLPVTLAVYHTFLTALLPPAPYRTPAGPPARVG